MKCDVKAAAAKLFSPYYLVNTLFPHGKNSVYGHCTCLKEHNSAGVVTPCILFATGISHQHGFDSHSDRHSDSSVG